ncbi:MAG: hypothetical protein J5507_04460 [Clostridia bacterium]|nr:hypothetical protein [Clostridia bacterium]
MKSQKGITLASLAIYIVLIFIVIGILATVTANIQGNVKNTNVDSEKMAEINKFNMYFIQEVKKVGNKIESIEDNNKTITFSSGKSFSFDNETNSIKMIQSGTQIEISKKIENCTFSSSLENGKIIITVIIKPQNTQDPIRNEYVLNEDQENSNYENEENYVYKSNNQVNEIENIVI